MTDETFDRPNKPGIWQRDGGINPISLVYENEAGRLMVISVSGYCRPNDEALARWRLIIDADGKQVCDPDEPWPPKTRIEKRRVVEWRDDTNGIMRVCYRRLDEEIRQPNDGVIIRYEIRDCKIEDGKVVRVIPKEGER